MRIKHISSQSESAPMHHIIGSLKLISKSTIFFLVLLTIRSHLSSQVIEKNIIPIPGKKGWGEVVIPPFSETLKWLIINHSKNIDKKRG